MEEEVEFTDDIKLDEGIKPCDLRSTTTCFADGPLDLSDDDFWRDGLLLTYFERTLVISLVWSYVFETTVVIEE